MENKVLQKWNKWIDEVKKVDNKIEINYQVKDKFSSIVGFYFDSVKEVKVFSRLYHNPNSEKPIVLFFQGHNSFVEQDFNVDNANKWTSLGYNVVIIDMPFQGGKTIDTNVYNYSNYPSACYNIDDLENCYSKRMIQHCIKIIDIIQDEKIFDFKNRDIIVSGPSQGGGLSLLIASITNIPIACLCDVPSDCRIDLRILGDYGKYKEVHKFIDENKDVYNEVLHNMEYFDVLNVIDNIDCPVFASIGNLDRVCPPEFFIEAYEKINSYKECIQYPEYGHGGFMEYHFPKKIDFLKRILNIK